MYVTVPVRFRLQAISANVVALGLVSLVTDVSAEMVTAVLPLYLVVGLGFSPLQFGLIDGLYTGAAAVVRILGGHTSDRWQRRKLVAGAGYALSAVAKLGLLAAGSSTVALGGVIAADRMGKGIRTAPRDALISMSVPSSRLGAAFGVHRAMDTLGALLGPIVAFAVLATTANAYDAVFTTSFCIAAFGVVLLVLFVRERPMAVRPKLSIRIPFRLCGIVALLGIATIGDGFVYLILARRLDLAATYFPLLPLGTALAYLALAVPLGRLADRIGRWRLFLGGHLLLFGGYLSLAAPIPGLAMIVVAPVLLGACYAATDGVLMAIAGPLFPEAVRGSGLAIVQSTQAMAKLAGTVAFGALWTVWGLTPALITALCGLAVAIGVASWLAKSS